MKHYEVVCAIIVNENDEIFICERGPGRALAYRWEFPGGKVEENETHEQSLVREIKEELNSTIEPVKYLGSSTYEYTSLEKPFSITLYAYKCRLVEGKLELSEHVDSKWVSMGDIRKYDFANADIPLLDLID